MQWSYSQSSTIYEHDRKDRTAYQNALLFMYGRIDAWVACFLFGIIGIMLIMLMPYSFASSTVLV